ncbi:MAG: hypothetical protein QXW83_04455 [Nitrososphaerales archaeon]
MPAALKGALGGVIGASIPVITEFASKGYRIKNIKGLKLSAVLGSVVGAISLGVALSSEYLRKPVLTDEDRACLGALGGAGIGVGVAMGIADYLAMSKKEKLAVEGRRGLEEREVKRESVSVSPPITSASELVATA